MTRKQRQKALEYWQAGLRIQDWDIEVVIVTDPRYKNFGMGNHSPTFKQSRIEILDERLIDPDWWGTHDWEVTLVHELLHIRFLYGDKDGPPADEEEVAIESVAKLLVAINRGISLGELN